MEYAFLFAATFAAFLAKALTGFGNTLVMGSLFSFVMPSQRVTPIDLVFSIPTNAVLTWRDRRRLSPRTVLPLSVLLVAGLVPGALLLRWSGDRAVKIVFGAVIVVMALDIWLREKGRGLPRSRALMVCIGLLSGVLAGLFGIGALLVSYIDRTTGDRRAFRANLCCVFLVENVVRLGLYWVTGIFSREALMLALALSPAVAAGMLAGALLDKRVRAATVKKLMIALLLGSGLTLVVKNLLGL